MNFAEKALEAEDDSINELLWKRIFSAFISFPRKPLTKFQASTFKEKSFNCTEKFIEAVNVREIFFLFSFSFMENKFSESLKKEKIEKREERKRVKSWKI